MLFYFIKMKPYIKTKLFTFILCLISVGVAVLVQLNAINYVEERCSYLDPITIDIFAFILSFFLIIEGYYRISEHKNMSIKHQFTRSLRIAIGFTILTIHAIQFLHK